MGTSVTGRHATSTAILQAAVDALLYPSPRPGAAAGPAPHLFAPYVQLGDHQYQVTGTITGLESETKAKFAQHDVIEGKPRLQAIGDELEQLTLTIELHAGYCDPVYEIGFLKSAIAAHTALPLIFASGELRGRYVLEQLNETHNVHDATGVPIHISVRLVLKEWVEDQTIDFAARKRAAAPAVKPAQRATAKTANPAWNGQGTGDPHTAQPFRGSALFPTGGA